MNKQCIYYMHISNIKASAFIGLKTAHVHRHVCILAMRQISSNINTAHVINYPIDQWVWAKK